MNWFRKLYSTDMRHFSTWCHFTEYWRFSFKFLHTVIWVVSYVVWQKARTHLHAWTSHICFSWPRFLIHPLPAGPTVCICTDTVHFFISSHSYIWGKIENSVSLEKKNKLWPHLSSTQFTKDLVDPLNMMQLLFPFTEFLQLQFFLGHKEINGLFPFSSEKGKCVVMDCPNGHSGWHLLNSYLCKLETHFSWWEMKLFPVLTHFPGQLK